MLQLLAGAPFSWIEADSGLGKTRLLAELADRRAEWGEATLYVACQRHRDLLLPSLITQARQQLGLPAAPAVLLVGPPHHADGAPRRPPAMRE